MSSKSRKRRHRDHRPPPPPEPRRTVPAQRHGLSNPHLAAELTCLYVEDRSEFVVVHEALAGEFEPGTASEALLVEEMAVCRWRLLRAWAMERALVDEQMAEMHHGIETCIPAVDGALRAAAGVRQLALNHARTVAHLDRYETRLSRQFDRALRRLRDLRAHPTERFVQNEPEIDKTEKERTNDRNSSVDPAQPVSAPMPTPVHQSEPREKRESNEPGDQSTDCLGDDRSPAHAPLPASATPPILHG